MLLSSLPRGSTIGLCFTSLLLCACGTSPAVEQALNAPLSIPDAVQQAVLDQVEHAPPSRPVRSMKSREAIDNKGEWKIVYADATYVHALTPQGLLDSMVSVNLKEGVSTGTSETFSLCGLVPIAITGGSKTNLSMTTAVPLGKLFLPASFSNKFDRASSGRLSALSVKAGRLCSPVPGETLLYFSTFESFYRQEGMFTTSGSRELNEDVSCTVGVSRQPASEIGFEGDYLPVTCEIKDTKNDKVWKKEYAFLEAARLYVLIAAKNGWQNSTVKYSDVVYGP